MSRQRRVANMYVLVQISQRYLINKMTVENIRDVFFVQEGIYERIEH